MIFMSHNDPYISSLSVGAHVNLHYLLGYYKDHNSLTRISDVVKKKKPDNDRIKH